ncbi:FG-GAPprotein [Angomonas deanei]|nr:FG-GAPprotein [Angomonas deanei]|eukprot:EPY40825.1 FG-GAPprotein [Angomonas deanei]
MVTSMMCLPWGKDISTALVVSSEDNELRVFRGEEVLTTFTEVDRVSQLIPSALRPALNSDGTTRPRGDMDGKFAYLLDNGTVGVYRKSERLWRVKGKSVPVSAAFCDLDCDGVEELVVGWQNGRVEVRSDLRPDGSNKGGEVLFRVDYNTPVAAVINEDYRDEGKELPIICSVDGTVRGVTLLESNLEDAEETRMLQQIEELEKERQMLTAQLSDLEGQLELKRKGESDALMPEAGVGVHVHVYSDLNIKKLVIAFSLVNGQPDTIIHSCALRCESSIFGDDTNDMCYINDISSKELHCVVAYPDDVSSVVHASIAVGTEHAESFQIHEMAVQIPKYVMYALPSAVQGKYTTPSGHVMLKYPKKLQLHTIDSNLREMFFLPPDLQLANTAGNELVLELLHIRDGSPLSITIRDTASGKGEIFIQAEKISTAGDVVTSLSSIPGGLCQEDAPPDEVSCDFPEELSQLRTLIQHVDESNEVRAKLSAGMADSAASVKTLLLCAENARLLGDLTTMRKVYSTLYEGNRELMGENAKRVVNFEELKGVLKELNTFIQWAAKLRVGNAKTELVAACRNALKDNRTTALIDLIRDGKE